MWQSQVLNEEQVHLLNGNFARELRNATSGFDLSIPVKHADFSMGKGTTEEATERIASACNMLHSDSLSNSRGDASSPQLL